MPTDSVEANYAWIEDKYAQARMRREVARHFNVPLREVKYSFFNFITPIPEDYKYAHFRVYRAAVRDALIAEVHIERARHVQRMNAYRLRHGLE